MIIEYAKLILMHTPSSRYFQIIADICSSNHINDYAKALKPTVKLKINERLTFIALLGYLVRFTVWVRQPKSLGKNDIQAHENR